MAKEVIYTGELFGRSFEVINNSWTMKGGTERTEYSIKIFREFEWNGKTCRDYGIALDDSTQDELKAIVETAFQVIADYQRGALGTEEKKIDFKNEEIPF